MSYPECDKLLALSRERDGAQRMYDYLISQGIVLCRYRRDGEDTWGQEFVPVQTPPRSLIAGCLEIDEEKLETERRAMLEAAQ